MSNQNPVVAPIQSTAGAVPVRNDKGQVSMQKVKVHRYISGKRPDYAPRSSSEGESEDEEFIVPSRLRQDQDGDGGKDLPVELSEVERMDPRLRRLQKNIQERQRRIEQPEVLSGDSASEEERPGRHYETDSDSEGEFEEDADIERRRTFLRQRALEKLEEEELLTKEEEKDSESEESESEYEEYTDSEEEARPRLKPVFVKKVQRVTIKPTEPVEDKRVDEEVKIKEEKRKETLKLVESEILRDKAGGTKLEDVDAMANVPKLTDVNTDDENEETEYESWKLRELKRIKRDREEREAIEKDRMELERIHNMTEDERRLEMKLKPKVILNKALKGKYKFLQKYYHRGVFYLDKDEDVFKRDNSIPTLEDHFDKTILPKVMQVKNFGRSGRTKYTHLVDQDTTNFESPWVSDSTQNVKFHSTQAAGVRQVFERPTQKKRKVDDDNM